MFNPEVGGEGVGGGGEKMVLIVLLGRSEWRELNLDHKGFPNAH